MSTTANLKWERKKKKTNEGRPYSFKQLSLNVMRRVSKINRALKYSLQLILAVSQNSGWVRRINTKVMSKSGNEQLDVSTGCTAIAFFTACLHSLLPEKLSRSLKLLLHRSLMLHSRLRLVRKGSFFHSWISDSKLWL